MKIIIKFILVLTLFFSAGLIYAQSTALNYSLESETVSISGQAATIFSKLTKVGNRIELKQHARGNVSIDIFDISSSSGQWNPNTSTGTLTYTVSMEGLQGLFTLRSTPSGIIVSLAITDIETQQQQLYIYSINTITYQ